MIFKIYQSVKGNPVFSVLICSLVERKKTLQGLLSKFKEQQNIFPFEVIVGIDNKEMPLGEKMNKLRMLANGQYVCFVDDDDVVTENYAGQIINATESNPDVICFQVMRYIKGVPDMPVFYSKTYGTNQNLSDRYLRLPNHLCAFKKELAMKVPFKEITWGIDTMFAEEILPMIQTEVQIEKVLYHYFFDPELSQCNP
jgi:glycosyltransferase involved in cell wall biosynthesis